VIVSNLLNLVTIHGEFIPPAASGKPSVHRPNCFQMPRTTDDQPFGASLDPDTVLVSTTTSTSDDGLFRHVLESVAQMEFPYSRPLVPPLISHQDLEKRASGKFCAFR